MQQKVEIAKMTTRYHCREFVIVTHISVKYEGNKYGHKRSYLMRLVKPVLMEQKWSEIIQLV